MAEILGTQLNLIFIANTLHQSKRGAVTGVLYFDFGGERQFPVAGWNDFVVIIACWWLTELGKRMRTRTETVLRFMDGPFWIKAVPQEGGKILLQCTEDRVGAGMVDKEVVGAEELEHKMVVFARELCVACDKAGFKSPDLTNLKKIISN